MSYEFVTCDIISTTSIKEEYEEDNHYASNTTINMNDNELKHTINSNNFTQHETNIADNIKTELLFSDVPNNIVIESDQIKEEASIVDDITVALKRERLFCDHCREEYQDYCTKCKMLGHILNRNTNDGTKDGIPKDILEIQYSFGYFHVFALKEIPDGVKFGPFVGLCSIERSWRVKDGKLLVSDDKKDILNWMQYINSTDDTSKQNLLVFQFEGNLYYRSNRTIQRGEELLVHFSEEYEGSLIENVGMEFHPAMDWDIKDMYACTFCCLGFTSEIFLSQHKTICAYKIYENFAHEELIQCPSCKIYLGQKEYLEHHVTYCNGRVNRATTASPPEHQLARVKEGHSTALKEHKKRLQLLHKCDLCKYKTSYKSDLNTHVNKHYEVKTYGCDICRRRFKTAEAFRLHATNTHVKFEEGQSEDRSTTGYYAKARIKARLLKKGRLGSRGESKQFACSKCDFKTKRRGSLREHAISKHSEAAKYNCSQCKFKTDIMSRLKVHVKSKHLDAYDYACAECEYRTNYKPYLNKHAKRKHEKHYKCSECEYESSYKSALKRHIKAKHVIEKDYKCDKCHYQTHSGTALTSHLRDTHVNDKEYKCIECEFKTIYKASLEYHIKTKHLKEFDYKCAECEFETSKKSYLKLHIKARHASEKRYKCAECAYEISRKALLDRHIRVKHRNEKSYRCGECEFVTSYKANLVAHIKAKHLKVCHYECPACEYVTSYKSQLKTHVKAKHSKEKEHKCTECPYETSNKAILKQHIKAKHVDRKEYKCTECTYKTVRESALEMHTKIKHLNLKPHKCEICGYETRCKTELAKHIKAKHINEKEYKCSECNFESSYKSALEMHTKIMHLKMKPYHCVQCKYRTWCRSELAKHVKAKHVNQKEFKCPECDHETSYKRVLEKHMKTQHPKDKHLNEKNV